MGNTKLDRRTFLSKSVAAVAGAGCLNFGLLREVVAQSRVTGRPLLTLASLNASIPKQLRLQPRTRRHPTSGPRRFNQQGRGEEALNEKE